MKKNNIVKVLLVAVLLVVLCSWIFPTTSYYYGLTEGAREQVGIFNLFSYPLVVLSYFGHILFYVLVVGALYGVLNKIPAYKTLLEKIAKGFKGKEWLFLVMTIILISGIVSITGFSLGMIVVFPLLISIILMLGYNKLVAVTTLVGSVICGMIGTTYGYNTVYYYDYLLETSFLDGTKAKLVIFVVTLAILLFNVIRYSKKVKNNNDEIKGELIPETVETKSKKINIWPLVIIFDLMLIISLVSIFPWSSVFEKFEGFQNALTWVQEYELFGFPIFSKILGTIEVFGNWSYASTQNSVVAGLPVLVIIATLLIALVYRVKLSDMIDNMIDGIKKSFGPAMIMVGVYLILIISVYHPFELTLIKPLIELTKELNVFTMSLVAFISSFFNVDSLYTANQVIPYIASVLTDSDCYQLIEIIFQSVYGLAMLVLPSSAILMGTLMYTGVSYGQWLKHIWKMFLEILVALLIIFFILFII